MKNIISILLLLIAIHFWRYIGISPTFLKLTDLAAYAVMGISFISMVQNKNLRFRYGIMFFLLGLILNIFSAYFKHGQEFKDTFLSMGYFYFILLYFFFHEIKPSKKDLENIIVGFALVYTIFFFVQRFAFPRIYFLENIFYDRGTVRMRISGDGFLMLAYFLLLNRYLLKHKIRDLVIALLFFLVLLLSGFRSLTAGCVLLSGFLFLKLVKYSPLNYVLIILAVVAFIGILQLESTSNIIDEMIHASEQQKEQGDRYIRKIQFEYFTKQYPQNNSYYIVGGGFPGARGGYSHQMGWMVQEYGFYWVDLGLMGFLLVMGGIATLGLLFPVFNGIFMKLPTDSLYLNVFLVFLVITTNITLDQLYRFGMFGVIGIVLYMIDISRDEKMIISSNRIVNDEISEE